MEKESKIKPEELRIEKISSVHEAVIKTFESYEPELSDFLKEDALEQQDRKISVTYLWFTRATNELVAYITICPDCVKLKNISEELAKNFRDKGINYKSLPSLKIGRVCVDNRFLRRGIGSLMIDFAINLAVKLSKEVGCRFLYLDAKRNEDSDKDAIHFYKKIDNYCKYNIDYTYYFELFYYLFC
jgi:predicted GNAT family N-acyltransferase